MKFYLRIFLILEFNLKAIKILFSDNKMFVLPKSLVHFTISCIKSVKTVYINYKIMEKYIYCNFYKIKQIHKKILKIIQKYYNGNMQKIFYLLNSMSLFKT